MNAAGNGILRGFSLSTAGSVAGTIICSVGAELFRYLTREEIVTREEIRVTRQEMKKEVKEVKEVKEKTEKR